MTVSETLAKFVISTRYSDIPDKSIQYTKNLVLSVLGSMLWASTLPAAKITLKLVKEWGGTPEAGVIGCGLKTSLPNAAFADGTFAHASEWEGDSRPEGVGMLSIVPAVLVLGEKYSISGKDMIETLVVAHEVQARIGLSALPATDRGFFSVPVFGTFGAAIVGAKLLKLSEKQIPIALSISASQAAGCIRQSGTMSHFIETGFSARNGLVAAQLAKEGLTAEVDIFEDKKKGIGFGTTAAGKGEFHPERITEGLGASYRIELIDTKHYPCHSYQQRALDGVLDIITKNKLSYKDIESVLVETTPLVIHELDLLDPVDGENARFSIQHGVAGAILEGKVGRDTFTDKTAIDPKFKEARRKVKLVVRAASGDAHQMADVVTVTLKDGKKFSTSVKSWHGHYTSPLNREELIGKFKDATNGILSNNQLEQVIQFVLGLENMNNITKLMDIINNPVK